MKSQFVFTLVFALLIALTLADTQSESISIKLKDIKDPKEVHQEKMKAVLDELKKSHEKKEEVTITTPTQSHRSLPSENKKESVEGAPATKDSTSIPITRVKPESKADTLASRDPFGWFFGDHGHDPFSNFFKRTFDPKVNVYSTEHADVLLLEVPGVKKEDLKIELKKNRREILTISGKRDRPEPELDNLLREDIHYGTFEKSFIVQRTNGVVKASLKDGVLRIVVYKKPIEKHTFTVSVE